MKQEGKHLFYSLIFNTQYDLMFDLGILNQARFNIYFPKTSGNGNETQACVTNFEGVKTFYKGN